MTAQGRNNACAVKKITRLQLRAPSKIRASRQLQAGGIWSKNKLK